MSNTSFLKQIRESRARAKRVERSFAAVREIEVLEQEWRQFPVNTEVFSDFVPIRLATCLEVSVRAYVKSLVDFNKSYAQRSMAMLKNFKVNLEFLVDFKGSEITLGEIVAHEIGTNSLEQIMGALTTLDPAISSELPQTKDRYLVEVMGGEDKPIIGDWNNVVGTIADLLKARHIIVHELPQERPYNQTGIDNFIKATLMFASALSWRIDFLTNGNSPLTQSEMTGFAFEKATSSEIGMNDQLQVLKASDVFEIGLLNMAQDKWLTHCESECELVASKVAGGSMYPMIYASHKATLMDDRTKTLQEWAKQDDGCF